ncbi:MAG: hypothetical protein KIS73_28505 [Enhydrobacter sp.]|nr:hypothetical protein [Enhydrobacter sp.]
MIRVAALAVTAALLLASCAQQERAAQADPRTGASAERYDRDREICRGVADDYMRRRRNIDDSRREVNAGTYERYGQTTLPHQMANYGDSRSADKVIASCMESRGWPQPSKSWWEKIGS